MTSPRAHTPGKGCPRFGRTRINIALLPDQFEEVRRYAEQFSMSFGGAVQVLLEIALEEVSAPAVQRGRR